MTSLGIYPLVSIIMPSYNHAHFISKAIGSVIDQTYANWELLIVDNHSSDGTDEVIRKFKDDRIKVLKIHNDGVIAASRNKGIKQAKGEWIAFLDSDDCWYPDRIATMINFISSNEGFDVLSTDELMVDIRTGETELLRFGPYEEDFYKVLLLKGNRLSPSATFIRHEFMEERKLLFNESKQYIAVEDYDLWLHLARAGARFHFINSVQGEYVIHNSNNSSQLLRQRNNFESLLRHHVFNVQTFEPSPAKLWKRLMPMLRVQKIKQLWNDGLIWKAVGSAVKALIISPAGMVQYVLSKTMKKL